MMFKEVDVWGRLALCLLASCGVHAAFGFGALSRPEAAPARPGFVEITLTGISAESGRLTEAEEPLLSDLPGVAEALPPAGVPPSQAPGPTPRPAPEPEPERPAEQRGGPAISTVIAPAAMAPDRSPAPVFPATPMVRAPAANLSASAASPAERPAALPRFQDAVPAYRHNPPPPYPRLARQRHWQGVVWLRINVSPEGRVAGLQIEKSSGYRVLDQTAAETVRDWTFQPARLGGVAVASQVRVPVEFLLEGS